MAYTDGFLLTVPRKRLDEYKKLAKVACKVWLELGALDYHECVFEEDNPMGGGSFIKAAKAKDDEVVIFAWIVYKTRAQRDRINKAVMEDPRIANMAGMDPNDPPFNMKKLVTGIFKTLVEGKAK